MDPDTILRKQLRLHLQGGNPHMTFDEVVAISPREHMNTKPPHFAYTPWHLLEHLRIAQWDILEFIRNPAHVSPPWPEGHWPPQDARADDQAWANTIAAFRADLHAFEELVADPATDLYAQLPHAPGYTILCDILVVADHNAYHTGEFAILRQGMQTWAW